MPLDKAAAVRRRRRGRQRAASILQKASRAAVELLVDADRHSLQEVRDGIGMLRQISPDGKSIRTSIFAAPRRRENKTWQQFFNEPGVHFRPVVRRLAQHGGEATDDAIVGEIRRLAKSGSVTCLAVMTSDTGFAGVISEVMAGGQQVIVLVSFSQSRAKRSYAELGAQVVQLPCVGDTGPKVRAILHEDGNGSVKLAEAFQSCDRTPEATFINSFLQDLGYFDGASYHQPAIINFWFANGLGPLTVFPTQCSIMAVYDLLTNSARRVWKRHHSDLAFVLPKSSTATLSKRGRQQYGTGQAKEIFRGAGPFVRRDSEELVAQVLHKMGYLDSGLNHDLSEAILVFVNVKTNKIASKQCNLCVLLRFAVQES